MIKIARPVDRISLNGKEYLLDKKQKLMKFKDKKSAAAFLKKNGITDTDPFLFERTA